MQVMHVRCAGLDVHKKTVVACVIISLPDGATQEHSATFGTMTPDVLALSDWLKGPRPRAAKKSKREQPGGPNEKPPRSRGPYRHLEDCIHMVSET